MTESSDRTIKNKKYYILQALGIIKEFSGVRVLDNVDFSLAKGEVHALLGENGAGKSTLVKILTGVYAKTEGKIFIDGKEVNFKSRKASVENGIGIIFQEFSQIPQLSITENLFLGDFLYKKKIGNLIKFIDWKKMGNIAKKSLMDFGIVINPSTPVKKIPVAKQQIVEIIKALLQDVKILIMDEPTASLSSEEVTHLFEIINELKKKGVSIIYISHRLEEVKKICDRATIIRDGKNIATIGIQECSIDKLINLMIGKSLEKKGTAKRNISGKVLLKLENLSSKGMFENVNFEVKSGEVVGISGLVGAGKTEIATTIFGINKKYSGNIYYDGKKISIRSPKEARSLGIVLIPEDRKRQGIISKLTARENIGLPNLNQYKNKIKFINLKKERESIRKSFDEVDIRPKDPEKLARYFSGGNQQKIVVSKWLASKARLYIFDEPTIGVDVGSKAEIYKLIDLLAENGCGIIICSSEIQEIINNCNKIIVMNRGVQSASFEGNEINKEDIIRSQKGGIEKK